ncbi:MAG: homoserine kinase [Gemmatimonadales bacterium]|nr:MAG: homoserine kinase [Gemmatimonadales bacterium]
MIDNAALPASPQPLRWAEAWAPASVGNISVGFDLLGHTLDVAGDRVRVTLAPGETGVRVRSLAWDEETVPRGAETPALPLDAERNTAGAALLALLTQLEADRAQGTERTEGAGGAGSSLPGFVVDIRKGIPLGSGMGGSAASAVAALTAANALLAHPLEPAALYPAALAGETVASGSAHGDNVGPQLLGGVVLALPDRLVPIPIPAGWDLHCALVHPHQVLETRRAREVLAAPFPLADVVVQSGRLAAFIAACYRDDLGLLRGTLADALVEPRRAPLIPGFQAGRNAALRKGALGAGISGGGPSIFAWFEGADAAALGARAMKAAVEDKGIGADAWSAPVAGPAARVESCG